MRQEYANPQPSGTCQKVDSDISRLRVTDCALRRKYASWQRSLVPEFRCHHEVTVDPGIGTTLSDRVRGIRSSAGVSRKNGEWCEKCRKTRNGALLLRGVREKREKWQPDRA